MLKVLPRQALEVVVGETKCVSLRPPARHEAQNDTERHREEQRNPRLPRQPQRCLPPSDEAANLAQSPASTSARFDEIAQHDAALGGLEEVRQPICAPPQHPETYVAAV